MKTMTSTRWIAMLLTIALTLSFISTTAFAASAETCAYAPYTSNASLLEVVTDNAPIRSGAGEKNSVVVRCKEGAVLEKTGSTLNRYLHRWDKVKYYDPVNNKCYTGYIYSERVKTHSHEFDSFTYDDVTYKYCACGKITVRATDKVKLSNALALTATSVAAFPAGSFATAGITAGGLALADGPFIPVGDIIGIGLLITVGIMESTGVIPSIDTVQDVWEDVQYTYDDKDICPIDSYRRVMRTDGKLKYIDKDCLSVIEAYVWVRTGNDVWCENYEVAEKIAKVHPNGGFSEIDSNGEAKDYYYHFHLGQCVNGKHIDVVGGHIFYGGSALTGTRPV